MGDLVPSLYRWIKNIVIFLACDIFNATGTQICNSKVDVCQSFAMDTSEAVVVVVRPDILREHCRRYFKFADCMDPVIPYCSPDVQMLFASYESSYNYLCKETFDEYVNYMTCLNNTALHQKGKECNSTLHISLRSIPSNKDKKICSNLREYVECIYNVVLVFCGEEAAKWQRGLDVSVLKPLANRIGCSNIEGKTEQSTPTEIYSIIGGLLLVCIFIVVTCHLYRRRKLRSDTRHRSSRNIRTAHDPPNEVPDPVYSISSHVNLEDRHRDSAIYPRTKTLEPPPYEICVGPPPPYTPTSYPESEPPEYRPALPE